MTASLCTAEWVVSVQTALHAEGNEDAHKHWWAMYRSEREVDAGCNGEQSCKRFMAYLETQREYNSCCEDINLFTRSHFEDLSLTLTTERDASWCNLSLNYFMETTVTVTVRISHPGNQCKPVWCPLKWQKCVTLCVCVCTVTVPPDEMCLLLQFAVLPHRPLT